MRRQVVKPGVLALDESIDIIRGEADAEPGAQRAEAVFVMVGDHSRLLERGLEKISAFVAGAQLARDPDVRRDLPQRRLFLRPSLRPRAQQAPTGNHGQASGGGLCRKQARLPSGGCSLLFHGVNLS